MSQDQQALSVDVDRIRRLEAERARAIVAADVDALSRITDDDYVHVEASGRVRNRAEFLAGVTAGGGGFVRYDLIDNTVRVFSDAAVVTGAFENSFVNENGERTDRRARHIRVYVRRPEGWRNVSHQATVTA